MADFETACQKFDIKLFILPPRSPKLNGHVERAQRTHTEELKWEQIYDTFRPHHSLDGLTPLQYLLQCHPSLVPSNLSHMY